MLYIVGWIIMLLSTVSLLFGWFRTSKVIVCFAILYCAILAFFRDAIGTDTLTYQDIFNDISTGESAAFGEIGFYWLAKLLLLIFNEPSLAVNAVSIVFFLFLFLFLIFADKNELFIFSSFILPIVSYQYSMNALRVGVAFSFFLVLFQYALHSNFDRKIKYGVLACVFHFSSAFYIVFLYVYNIKILTIKWLVKAFLLMLVFLGFIVFFREYIVHKFLLYSNYDSPGGLSGLRIVIPIIIVLLGVFLSRLYIYEKLKFFVFVFSLASVFFVIVQFSYSGLRLLDLLLMVTPMAILLAFKKENKDLDINIKLSFVVAGLLFSIGTYLGFDQHFIPYRSWLLS